MLSIFQKHLGQKCLYTPLVSAAVATFLLTGCGASDNAQSDSGSASSTASASSSQSATQTPSSGSSNSASQDSDSSENGSGSVDDTYEGADAIASAQTVSIDQEQVKTTEDLYTQYEDVLSSVKTETTDSGDSEANNANSGEDSTSDSGSKQLSEETISQIEKVATGSAADEFAATALEFGVNGWSQEGTSKIVGEPKLANTTFNGQQAKILEVCIDSSDVSIKDSAGNNLSASGTPQRSLNIFTLTEDNGTWKIAAHDFPNNPDC